jgi:signal transduction histidine kinase/CheY-like chemotaxis protein
VEVVEAVRPHGLTCRSREGERKIRTNAGEERVWDFSSSPIGRLPDGRRLVVTMATDITDRKRAEKENRRLEKRVRQAEKMAAVGELAAGIAHNINNHLTPILGNAELLGASPETVPEHAEMLEDIIRASRRAAELVDQLLAFGRKGRFRNGPVDMSQVIREVADLLAPGADKRIDVTLNLLADAPTVTGDATQLQNTLLNLTLNACDAMPDGGELTFTTEDVTLDKEYCRSRPYEIRPGRYLRVSVADTGIGMDEEVQARIFEPFFTTKKTGKGTGLGLASVYGCVKGHHGSIEVESAPGHGATFDLFLPIEKSAEDTAMPVAGAHPSSETGRILVVDDETPLCSLVGAVLEDLGYAVTRCPGARETLEHYTHHCQEIDLIVLGFEMPQMDGLETLRRIKAVDPEVCVLMTSLHVADEAVAGEAFGEGAAGVLSMPFEIKHLAEFVAPYVKFGPTACNRATEPVPFQGLS